MWSFNILFNPLCLISNNWNLLSNICCCNSLFRFSEINWWWNNWSSWDNLSYSLSINDLLRLISWLISNSWCNNLSWNSWLNIWCVCYINWRNIWLSSNFFSISISIIVSIWCNVCSIVTSIILSSNNLSLLSIVELSSVKLNWSSTNNVWCRVISCYWLICCCCVNPLLVLYIWCSIKNI